MLIKKSVKKNKPQPCDDPAYQTVPGNPPRTYSVNVSAKVGRYFLNLVNKTFHRTISFPKSLTETI